MHQISKRAREDESGNGSIWHTEPDLVGRMRMDPITFETKTKTCKLEFENADTEYVLQYIHTTSEQTPRVSHTPLAMRTKLRRDCTGEGV